MDCEKARELIFRAADGDLSADEQTALNAHLAECVECRAVCDALAAVSAELRETASVPEDFAQEVMDAVHEEKKIIDLNARREKLKKRFQPGNIAIWVACACLVVMVGIVELTPVGHTKNVSSPYFMADQAAVFESAEAESAAAEEAAPVAEEAALMVEEAAEAPAPEPEMPASEPPEAMPEAAEFEEDIAVNGTGRGADTPDALVPALMVNGTLYRTTGTQLPVEPDVSAIVGHIRSVVPLSQWPETEGQANFGEPDAPYALIEDGLIVLTDGEWTLFEPISE